MDTHRYRSNHVSGYRAGPATPAEPWTTYSRDPKIGMAPKGGKLWDGHQITPCLRPAYEKLCIDLYKRRVTSNHRPRSAPLPRHNRADDGGVGGPIPEGDSPRGDHTGDHRTLSR